MSSLVVRIHALQAFGMHDNLGCSFHDALHTEGVVSQLLDDLKWAAPQWFQFVVTHIVQ